MNKTRDLKPIDVESMCSIINYLPNPFGTFEKAKYVIYGYAKEVFYSCITTCRSEESMLDLLLEKAEIICYMREYDCVRIVKVQNRIEKVLFKGNLFKRNGNEKRLL